MPPLSRGPSLILFRAPSIPRGPRKATIHAHAAVVAQHSKTLDILDDGQLKDASEDCAILEVVDEDTFIRLGRFTYTRDYDAASPRPVGLPFEIADEI